MDRRAEKQARILQRRTAAAAGYPALWERIISAWSAPGDDRVWLVYSANYLFRTGEVRWAIDPLTLRQRYPDAPQVELRHSLSQLSFVLLTHRHADHLDLELIRALRSLPIRWVVPEALLAQVVEQAELPLERVIIPRMLEPLHIQGITITPFEGLHWEYLPPGSPQPRRGVPAVGYLVEFGGQRWLFPGDTRTYTASHIPNFGKIDGMFAHLWLGRSCALLDEPPLVEAFCSFCHSQPARQLVITHLEELGRQAEEHWERVHYELVAARLQQLAPGLPVRCAVMGESLPL